MNLYLVQHGEAKAKEDDPERGLTEKGMKDVELVGGLLSDSGRVKPASILHSGKKRAVETAEYLGELLKPADGVSDAPGLAPGDDPAEWVKRLEEAKSDVMLVGHLPHLARLASLLVAGDADASVVEFSNGCCVNLARGDRGWSVAWMVVPGLLRGEWV